MDVDQTIPTLSIITICLNDAMGLEKTIASVAQQTFRNFEHLIIDGGSTDGSAQVIEKNREKFSYSVSEKDSGRYNAMNKGITAAKGKYCLFLNAGDYLANASVLATVFTENKDSDLLYGDLIFEEKNKERTVYRQPPQISLDYLMRVTLLHPATFIKTSLFGLYGWYDESFKIGADYDFFLRVLLRHEVTTWYLPYEISVFNKDGISMDPKFIQLDKEERRRAQKNNLPLLVFDFYQQFAPTRESVEFRMMEKIRKIPLLRFLQKAFYKLLEIVSPS